ncbi:transposase [Streptomyces hydrogenans]|uniref:transposase n=1 Tax=Streptomyces hydrogenans TaxID=1873719 RepID=UPI0035D64918
MAVEAAESRHTAVAGERAIARMVQTLVGELASLNEEVAEVEGRIESRFREHDRAEIIESVPGIGAVLGAEFLAAVDGSLNAFATPDRLAALARVTPAPPDSGKISGNLHRPKRDHRGLQ